MICTLGDRAPVFEGAGHFFADNATIIGSVRLELVVGAHALVTEGKEFPDGSLIIGAPAKAVRQLADEEIAGIGASADHYFKNAARYNSDLVPRS
mgnify:FL=1